MQLREENNKKTKGNSNSMQSTRKQRENNSMQLREANTRKQRENNSMQLREENNNKTKGK